MQYGPMMIDILGTSISEEERLLLGHARIGGVILFSRNFQNIAQLKRLVADIRAASRPGLLIAVDHEGGRVWRFTEGFTKLPPARLYSERYAVNKEEGLKLARNAGWIMAYELLECGLDLSLAPVLDIDRGISEVIGDRAFHKDPKILAELAGAFIDGMEAVGMRATGKHFPGHGGCAPDSHLEQPIDNRTLDALMQEDMVPFQLLSKKLGAVMPAHITYPAVDSVPAGFSKRWLQDLLRKGLNFHGVILSDCLSMKGAAIGGDFVVRAQMAIDAGCDMVILCQQERSLVRWVLDNLDRDCSDKTGERLKALAGKFQIDAQKKLKPVLDLA